MKNDKVTPSLRFAVLAALCLILLGCYTPPPYPPPPTSRPPQNPCQTRFNPCQCEIKMYRTPMLDRVMQQGIRRSTQREARAANFSFAATAYKEKYWKNKNRQDAYFSLRLYDSYLGLVEMRDPMAGYGLLHSIAIYCDLGCYDRARNLAQELRQGYRFQSEDLSQALAYCRH